jgi:glyoxylase-like metal-dependent hydrolase (beta-lactamase superfamily II)
MDQVYTASKVVDHLWAISEGGVRCFLCEGARAAMLVDTGYGGGKLKAFVQTLTDRPVFVVNTHTDGDHVGCNALFGSARMHPAEYGYYAAKKPGDKTQLSPLWEGDVIDLGTMKFEIILIPGTRRAASLYLTGKTACSSGGDSVQRGAIFMFGPGRNLPAYICSMEKAGRPFIRLRPGAPLPRPHGGGRGHPAPPHRMREACFSPESLRA